MRRPLLFALAAAAVVAALLLVFALSPGAEPVRLSRSDVTVQLDEPRTGSISVLVEVPARVSSVSLFAVMPQMGHVTPQITATQENPGLFRTTSELFPMTGLWELTVRADDAVVTFNITVK
jgi:hypothetical protein